MSAKYPRTPHLPWSPGGTRDDKRLTVLDQLYGRTLVFTEKLDGSNLCLTADAVYARSHSGAPRHPSFDAAKALHARVRHLIPRYFSVFGEWCMAVHSIKYNGLPHYFNLFAIRDDEAGVWLPWDKMEAWAGNWGVDTVPELLRTTVESEQELRKVTEDLARQPSVYGAQREGLVVRPCYDAYSDEAFWRFTAKWVREDHVQTDEHWSKGDFIKQPRRPA
jgi:hypothetical protein